MQACRGGMGLGEQWFEALLSGRVRVVRRVASDRRVYVAWRASDGGAPCSAAPAEVARRTARGHATAEIGFELGLAPSTVSTHLAGALSALRLERLDLPLLRSGALRPRGTRGAVLVSSILARRHLPELTEAERDVVTRVLVGSSNAMIAAQRRTSARTVANQLRAVHRKLGVCSRLDLAALAARRLAADRSHGAPAPRSHDDAPWLGRLGPDPLGRSEPLVLPSPRR